MSPGYFEVFKIPVIRGRTFTEQRQRGRRRRSSSSTSRWRSSTGRTGDPLNDRSRDRPRRDARVRRGAGPADHRRRRRQPRQRAQSGSRPEDVRAAGADSRRASTRSTRSISPMAWVIRTKVPPLSISAPVQAQLRAGDRPAGRRHPLDGPDRVALDVARAVQHAAHDGVRAVGARARRDRHLRRDGVRGAAAHARDRRAARARRGAERRAAMVVLQGMRLALDRRRHRRRRRRTGCRAT